MNKINNINVDKKYLISEEEEEKGREYNDDSNLLPNNNNFEISLKNIDLPYSKSSPDKNTSNLFTKKKILKSFDNKDSTLKLQKNLIGISKEMINNILFELKGEYRNIIKNRNGNYFFSSLIKKCNKEQRSLIIKELCNTMYEDCNHFFGTHSLQTLIETSSNEEEFKLLLSSFNDCYKIAIATMNKYGTHIIKKLIQFIPEGMRIEFNLMFVRLIIIFSRDKFGVSAVEKFITYTKNNIIVEEFLRLIMDNFINLTENQYGNYLIQYLLNKWWNKKEGIFFKKEIKSKFRYLMGNKYSIYICRLFLKLENNL